MSFKDAYITCRPTKPPSGWSSIDEVAKDLGVNEQTACRKLTIMAKQGLVEKKRMVLWDARGNAAQRVFYRLVKK